MRRRWWFVASCLILCAVAVYGFISQPFNLNSIHNRVDQKPLKIYDYYIIIDEKSGEHLMYVPLVVQVGDEVITEKNQRFRIIKVIENQAYAHFVENVKLPQP